jgi:hypothetical protein
VVTFADGSIELSELATKSGSDDALLASPPNASGPLPFHAVKFVGVPQLEINASNRLQRLG